MKTFKDIYEFPLSMWDKDYYTRVHDAKGNFVFQFTFYDNYALAKKLLDTINGKYTPKIKDKFKLDNGIISFEDKKVIMIRGWGNLTGTGAHNLKEEEAANIQDTFAEHLVEKLNGNIC